MKKISAISRVLAFLLVVCLCSAFVPVMTFADEVAPGTITVTQADGTTVETLTDTVGDNKASVLTAGDGTVSYDADASVVTLNGITVKSIQFAMNEAFTVTLVGTNTVLNYINGANGKQYAFYSSNAVAMTIDGEGSLIINKGNSTSDDVTKTGNQLYAKGDLIINGGTIDVTAQNYAVYALGNLTVNGGSLTVLGQSQTIRADGKITITGGDVSSTGTRTNTYWHLYSKSDFVMTGGTLSITKNKYAIDAGSGVYSITGGSITGSSMHLFRASSNDVTIDVGAKASIDFTFTDAVIENTKSKNVTITGDAKYAEGYELTATATKSKVVTVVPVAVDATINATVAGKDASVQLFNGDALVEEKVSENGAVSFSVAGLTEGTYTYTLKQNAENGAGWTYDASVKEVTVVVDAEGNVSVTEGITFTNTYAAAGTSATIEATVTLNGEVSDREFVILVDGVEVPVVDGKISLTKEYTEAGTYYYILTQKNTELGGVTYDNAEYLVTVTVTDNGEGQLIASVGENNPTFANTYDYIVDTAIDVNVKVSVSDRTLKEGDVTVTLTKGETVITGTIDAEGNVVLTIPASKDMAGVYTVSLSTEIKGITLPAAQTVTVTVEDDGDGVANVTATNTDLTFHGSYRVPFAAGKIVNGKYIVDETGKATEMGLVKIGNDYYYVGPNGVLVTGKYYAWLLNENCDIETGWYCFGADGKMLQGICEHPDKDGLYYFETGKPTEKGLFLYDGDYYVAQYDGKIITGKYYVWKIDDSAKDAYVEGWYEFDEKGVIVPLKNGIVDGKYYVDGKPTEMGLFEYEGDLYVAQYDGKIITGKYYVWKVQEGLEDLNGAWRYFGKDGKLLQGIVDGYYYVNGVRTEMGLFKYTDNNYYVAQYDGKIITSENYTKHGAGKYYVWKIHESANDKKAGWYFFDAKGRMIQWFNDKVYSIEFANTPATYESATNNTAWNAQNNPNTYGGSFAFDGWNYVAFSEDVITSGLTTVPVYAHNDTDATAKARTIFAVESTEWVDYKLHYVCSGADVDWMAKDGAYTRIQIGDTWYTVGVYTYEGTVEAGENTWLSMYQFFMDKTAEATDGNYQILFLNQLVGENEEFAAVDAEYAKIVFNADHSEETPKP